MNLDKSGGAAKKSVKQSKQSSIKPTGRLAKSTATRKSASKSGVSDTSVPTGNKRSVTKPTPGPIKSKGGGKVDLVSSKLAYRGPLFDVFTDYIQEPGKAASRRDVIRHSGSVVILAVDTKQNADDPTIVVERQYRHAAGQYMWEVPAGRKEPGETPLYGAKRELLEETGYRAKRWSKLVLFYASPGFLAEWMQVYVAEELTVGQSQPDEDEYIECRQIPLSQALQWIDDGKIIDAKSIVAILQYVHRRQGVRRG